MSEDAILTTMEKEMIALGASIAAGCQPCTTHHLKAAVAAGTCDKGTTLAVTVGDEVRRTATEAMARWGLEQLGGRVELPDEWLAQRKHIRALVSVAAAFAVNSVTEFERCVREAHDAGATDRQIQLAVTLARKIKSVAAEKMESAAQQAWPSGTPHGRTTSASCGCSA